ncbi:hypothetical protein [Providencia manganoxydans]|uniref:hypothetical protein n=1 Tax=Providencia manganoxydans TaxID=2923283 RepID=UPI0034E5EFFB
MIEFLILMWGYITTGIALGFGLTLGGILAISLHRISNYLHQYFMFYAIYPLQDKYRLWRLKK